MSRDRSADQKQQVHDHSSKEIAELILRKAPNTRIPKAEAAISE